MIAKVRIAPVEHWCKSGDHPQDILLTRLNKCANIVGQEIEIKTETMRTDEICNGKAWFMTSESARLLDKLLGRHITWSWENEAALICEHMLEMD